MASRLLSDLSFSLQAVAAEFLDRCRDEGINIIITCTYRSNEEQDRLYEQGRTTPGHIVTHARGGESKHNFGNAFDVVPIVDGKPCWDDTNEIWQRIGKIGKSCGLTWGGDWPQSKIDMPHFEI